MITRGQNFQQIPLNVVGSSTFGRYPKISVEKTYNMFISDNFLVDYAGYEIIIPARLLGNGKEGRGIFTSTKLGSLVVVISNQVYLVNINYDQVLNKPTYEQIFNIGQVETFSGPVYITENNKPQILISDNRNLYIYDPNSDVKTVKIVPNLDFTPGYITFHDSYFIAAASNDTGSGTGVVQNNTWRLSLQNEGYVNPDDPDDPTMNAWPYAFGNVGLLQTKPDNVQAVVRFPSKGNMIFVMGSIVTESWFDTGAQQFPYQRQNQYNIDYGCLSPASVAYMDEIVVWLAANEKSGPIIMYSDGGMPKKITTDGIDQLFSELQKPEDSQGFLYRQDGHLIYHINFYYDNLSLFYDFPSPGNGEVGRFYHACDQNMNYFIAAEIAFIQNQYYFVSKNSGNLYAFDTAFTTYEDVVATNTTTTAKFIIPRLRICKNIRLPSQEPFILNDIGFTIESGETPYYQQNGTSTPIPWELLSNEPFYLLSNEQFNLLDETENLFQETPKVCFSMSYDGGAVFGSEWAYQLPGVGYRRNLMRWWQGGWGNDFVPMFKFVGCGRFVVTDGVVNIRY
jgi:hypothetical protein